MVTNNDRKKIVVLANASYAWFFDACKTYNDLSFAINSAYPFNSPSFLARIISKIIYILAPPAYISFFWRVPRKTIEKCSCIIMPDSVPCSKFFLRRFKKHFSDKRLIVYYLNTIKNRKSYEYFKKINIEQWSFDKKDSLEYGLRYNKTFIMATTPIIPNVKITTDVFFIGIPKDRAEKIKKIEKILEKLNISMDIRILEERSEYIPYKYVCELVQKSLAILDVVIDGQEGSTQREMEALHYKKKLISTNENVKTRDYYNENNIYYLDLSKQEHNDLYDFLRKPFQEIDKNIYESYSYYAWINRFFKEAEDSL